MESSLLHYKIYGKRENTSSVPVVLLHGLLGELENWQTQARRLAQQHYVISIDLRNHGHSPHLKGMSYRQMAEDVQHLLMFLQCSNIQLLGHSMGGKVAMYLALHQPTLIQRLIVVDIAPKTYPLWHQHILQSMLSLPLAHFTQRKTIDQVFAEVVPNASERGFLLKNLQRKRVNEVDTTSEGVYQWKCDLAEIARNYLKIADFPHSEKRYLGKVLFIKGELSDYLQPEDEVLLSQYFPNYRLQRIERAGHLPHVEQMDVFYGVIRQALD